MALAQAIYSRKMQHRKRRRLEQEIGHQPVAGQARPSFLRRQNTPVNLDAHFGLGILLGDHVKLPSGALVVTGQTEQLEEKGAQPGVHRVRSNVL